MVLKMDGGIILNLNQENLGGSKPDGRKKVVSTDRRQRIRNRRKEKKKQWKEKVKLIAEEKQSNETTPKVDRNDSSKKIDVKSDDKPRKRKTNDIISSKEEKSNHGNKKNISDVTAQIIKKKKSGAVISSLFRRNPDIPKVTSSNVKRKTEDVFTSDSFNKLPLHPYMVKTLEEQLKLEKMTSVQQKAIPALLGGHDSLVRSQTGSGKTLAFAVPIVEKLQSLDPPIKRSDGLYAVVVVPTRELALQCFQVFLNLVKPFIRIVPGVLIGGEKRKAEKARLSKGINILVCTPGRLLDHLQHTASLTVDRVQFLVLDEADRLCEMGYEKNIAEIVTALNNKAQCKRQTVLLSATLSEGVERLAGITMDNPKHIFMSDSEGRETTGAGEKTQDVYTVPQKLKQYFVITPCKLRLVSLAAFILWKCKLGGSSSKVVVFMPTQDSVSFHHKLFNTVFCDSDQSAGKQPLKVFQLHGDMQQKDRTETFHTFSQSKHGVLLCTDVAARGLDLASVQWIVQYTAPTQETDYIHRIGRTARAGSQGSSLLFLLPSEVDYVGILNKQKISLEEMKMKKLLTCLVPYIADTVTDEDDSQRSKPRDLIESATFLQMKFETLVHKDTDLLNLARRGYQSFVRAYATYPSHLKSVFKVPDLHLGHVAKIFGLRESPGGMGVRAGVPEKKKSHESFRPPQKRRRVVSEFDSGLTGIKEQNLGPNYKKNVKNKKRKMQRARKMR